MVGPLTIREQKVKSPAIRLRRYRDVNAGCRYRAKWQRARFPAGHALRPFSPDVMSTPVQRRHLSYHGDGAGIELIKDLAIAQVFAVTP